MAERERQTQELLKSCEVGDHMGGAAAVAHMHQWQHRQASRGCQRPAADTTLHASGCPGCFIPGHAGAAARVLNT